MNEQPEPLPGYFPPVSATPPAGYRSPPPGYVPSPPPASGVNLLAVFAILAIFFSTPGALVLGLVARSQIRQTGQRGLTMAWIGIVGGALGVVLYLVGVVFLVALLGGFEWLR